MKPHLLWLIVLWTGMAGCVKTEMMDSSGNSPAIPIQFTLGFRTEVLPFPTFKSMPDIPFPEPALPDGNPDIPPPDAEDNQDLSDLCTRLDYLVYSGEEPDIPLKHKQFYANDTDMDFGIVYDSLPAGDYRFVFIAHSSQETEFADGVARFDEVSDTFFACEQRAVSTTGESQTADISLRRPVCRIEFVSTDPVPPGLEAFEIRVGQYPEGLHFASGYGTAATVTQAFLHSFTAEETGKPTFTHLFYTFIPPDKGSLDLELTATDREGKITRRRQLTDVVPLPNRIIRYSGRLYTPAESDDTFRLEVYEGGKWESTDEVELPD